MYAKIEKDPKVSPRIVFAFFVNQPGWRPSWKEEVEFDIDRVHIMLRDKKRLKTYTKLSKQYPEMSNTKLVKIMRCSTQKKYRDRDSPPFPANELCGSVIKGTDGKYESVKNKKGVCSWKKH